MNKNPYVCLNRFILRFPVYSSDKVLNYNHGNNFLFELFSNDSFFRNAICIASYELYRFLQIELKKEHIDNDTRLKLNISLYKYYSRMCTRSTPFGLFSGVMAGEILYKNQFQIDLATVRISQQFDNSFLYKIVKKEFELKGENILLFLNNTMKRYGNKYRYIEESVNKSSDKKTFSVSETKYNRILNQIFNLTKNGITKDTLIEKIRVSFRAVSYTHL
ncbi:lantibiotic dehydratase, partial [Chryseobacterium rhizosphaerae]